jgi:class 3 adenylate cyclase
VNAPKTRYARTRDGVHVAYQVVGDGPTDLVFVAWGVGLGQIWNGRRSGSFLQRLSSFSRLIVFDRRGSGLSDHVLDQAQQLTLESRTEDVRAVMDAVGSPRATLLGLETGGASVAMMFAATLPERTTGLVLYGAGARELRAPDYPIGRTLAEYDADIVDIERGWATEELAREWAAALYPAARDDPREIEDIVAWMASFGGPGDIALWTRVDRDADVRDLLPSVRVPTLVIHRRDDRVTDVEHGRYLAAHIPGAEFVELSGDAHMWDVGDDLASEVERFVSSLRQEEIELDRYLATVLFTDIVDSTAAAAAHGDRAWRTLVEEHHHIVRGALARYRGTEMDTAGDGFFATFDGPARAVRCALAAIQNLGQLPIQIRAGVHTGEMQVVDGKAGGIAVTLGARIAGMAGPSEVLVSPTVKDLVAGSGLAFEDAGEHELKGVPERWHLYRVAHEPT